MTGPKTRMRIGMGVALLLVGGVAAACAAPASEPAAPAETPVEEHADEHTAATLEGNVVRGGLLYDKWWAVESADQPSEHDHDEHEGAGHAPEGDHPLWSTQDTNTRSGADTWRCKECHGWDYKGADGAYGSGSHATGFAGVYDSRDKPAAEVLAALQGDTNPDHDFSAVMGEQDLIDLAVFITEGLIDDSALINADKSSTGEAAAGVTLFGEVCTKCHGPDGNAINFKSLDDPEFLGHLAPDNPWEFVHKVRFGQPGWPMPSGISNGWTDADVADVLAYVQGFPAEPALSGGGQLYDMWWAVLGLDAPADDHPLWSTQETNTRSGADTWRCKECHGWDYLGADGAYGSGSHATGFTGVMGAASMSTDEIVAWLTGQENPDHDFSVVMDDYAIDALAQFLKDELQDVTGFVNDDKSVSGDPARGKEMFEGTCAACHGVDGRKINFANEEAPEYVGTVGGDNPWEFLHKASFGQPGAPMPAGHALGWSLEQIVDLAAYVQTLPTQ